MLDRTNYGFCHEFYAVEKAIEVVVEQGGEPLQLRIEARLNLATNRYVTRGAQTGRRLHSTN